MWFESCVGINIQLLILFSIHSSLSGLWQNTFQVRQRRMGASLCQTLNFCCYYKENGTICTPNHSPPRLLLPSLMGIQMQRNFSKKTDLGSQCFMLQRIMHFLKFFLWEHLFSRWCYFMDCIYFFHFVHSYQCVYFHSHALETEVPFPISTNPCNPHQR